jgi:hypothetical protein
VTTRCLTIYTSAAGLCISILFPFRLGHPPVFIPWDAVRNPRVRRFLGAESVEFDIDSPPVATVRLFRKVFDGRDIVPAGESAGREDLE